MEVPGKGESADTPSALQGYREVDMVAIQTGPWRDYTDALEYMDMSL